MTTLDRTVQLSLVERERARQRVYEADQSSGAVRVNIGAYDTFGRRRERASSAETTLNHRW